MFHGHLDDSLKPSLGGRPNTKPWVYGTPNAHNCWFILFYHVWGPTWIEFIEFTFGLGPWLHMASHYTWGPETTLRDCESVLRWPLDTFWGALTISWSRLLACVWSGPKIWVTSTIVLLFDEVPNPWTPTHTSNAHISVLFVERNWRVHFNELRTFVPLLMPGAFQSTIMNICYDKPLVSGNQLHYEGVLSTNFEKIQWSQSWSSQVRVANEYFLRNKLDDGMDENPW